MRSVFKYAGNPVRNSMKLCSVLIPSRHRIDQLFRAIDSIISSASETNNYQIAVYLDDDDTQSVARVADLEAYPVVSVTVGPSPGYSYLDRVHTQMAKKYPATWIWIVNDDMTIKADAGPWNELLTEVPTTGYYIQPEIHQLGGSVYPRDPQSCSPMFVNGCWETLCNCTAIPTPCDCVLVQMLNMKGWKPWFLKGVTVWHQRNKPA